MSDRFFCPEPPRHGRYRLGPEESRHLSRVCRKGVGDRVEIFDGRGFVSVGEVVACSGDSVELLSVGEPLGVPRAPCSLVLATAVPKGDRFDWLVEKATEMGVDRLIPIISARSVVAPRESKIVRLRRLVVEASKQCRRSVLMAVDEPLEWSALVGGFADAARFLADPGGLQPSRWPTIAAGSRLVLAVGPEGGLTEAERDLAIGADWAPIRLGCQTLRVETAGLAGCAALLTRMPEDDE